MSDDDSSHTVDLEDVRDDFGQDIEEEDDDLDMGEGVDLNATLPDKETCKIIEMYRSTPQLYDVSHPSYPNRDKKLATLRRMCKEVDCSSK
jgi:hypothetical protein